MHNFTLILLCLVSIVTWPVNRQAIRHGARMENLGLVTSFIAFILGILAAAISGQNIFSMPASLFGVGMGIAFSVGFYMIIFYCIKIGPTGPTTAINNLGVIFPIMLSLLFFSKNANIKALAISGLILISLALISMAFVNTKGTSGVSGKWKILVFIGWLFSGVSMSMQFLATHYDADSSFAFAFSTYFTSFIILLSISLYKRNIRLTKTEIAAGAANGVAAIAAMPLLFYTVRFIAGYIVFPAMIIIPIIVMMLASNFIYKEKLNNIGWIATILGVAGIILVYL